MDNEYTVYDNKPNNSQMADNEQTQLDNNAAFRANNAWREHKNRRQCPTWVKVAGGAGAGLLIGTAASILFTPDVQAQTEPEPDEPRRKWIRLFTSLDYIWQRRVDGYRSK